MGGATLGGPGWRRATAVHNEIYGAQGESAAPGGKKSINGNGTRSGGLVGMGAPGDRESADTCDTPVGGALRAGGQGAGSAGYHDTPHAAARRGQILSEGGRVSQRGLGGASAAGRVTGPGEILRGGGPSRPCPPRATAMDGLSPPAGPWGGRGCHMCDIDDTLTRAQRRVDRRRGMGGWASFISSTAVQPHSQGWMKGGLLGWVSRTWSAGVPSGVITTTVSLNM